MMAFSSSFSNVAYRLNLPEPLKLHPTFDVSYLKPCHDGPEDPNMNKFERAPSTMREELEHVAEQILDHRVKGMSKKNRRTFFLVKWKRLPDSEVSLGKDTTLWKLKELILDYLKILDLMRASGSSGGGRL